MTTFTIRFRALLPMTNSKPLENGQLIVERGRIREIFSDTMNALMAIPNLIGLVCLSGLLVVETQLFEEGLRKGSINKFD